MVKPAVSWSLYLPPGHEALNRRIDGESIPMAMVACLPGEQCISVECPVSCGRCCEMWLDVPDICARHPEVVEEQKKRFCNGVPLAKCPELGPEGCRFELLERPEECRGYLCELGLLAQRGMVTGAEIQYVLQNDWQIAAAFYLGKTLEDPLPPHWKRYLVRAVGG